MVDNWLRWARELQALAQTGMHFSDNDYHRDRYRRVAEIAAEMTAEPAAAKPDQVLAGFLAQAGYATPKVDVRGAVLRAGRILLVRERQDQRWCMPGGWADVGESAAEMVVREVREESGLVVAPVKLVAVFDANRAGRPLEFYHAYKLVFLCRWLEGEPTAGDETLDVGWFPPEGLPPLSEQRTHPRHLAEVWAHAADPARPTYFE